MQIINNVLISISEGDIVNGVFTNEDVTEVATNAIYAIPYLKELNLPNVKIIQNTGLYANPYLKELNLPNLESIGDRCLGLNPKLEVLNLPKLKSIGNDCLSENRILQNLNLIKLQNTGFNCFTYNSLLKTINIPNIEKTGMGCFNRNTNLEFINGLKIKTVDGVAFNITSEKKLKGVTIYDGFNVTQYPNTNNEKVFVAEAGIFCAHGKTIKQAILDLRFKIKSENFKNEPITKETKITIEHYRAVTGACEYGVKNWMRLYNMKEGVTVSELLPILRRSHAYGIEKFEKLLVSNLD